MILNQLIFNLNVYPNSISDRTIIDNLAYSLYLHKNDLLSDDVLNRVILAFDTNINKYDKIFYVKPEFDIEADGLRDTDKLFQVAIDNIIYGLLTGGFVEYSKLTGSVEERCKTITSEIGVNSQ